MENSSCHHLLFFCSNQFIIPGVFFNCLLDILALIGTKQSFTFNRPDMFVIRLGQCCLCLNTRLDFRRSLVSGLRPSPRGRAPFPNSGWWSSLSQYCLLSCLCLPWSSSRLLFNRVDFRSGVFIQWLPRAGHASFDLCYLRLCCDWESTKY